MDTGLCHIREMSQRIGHFGVGEAPRDQNRIGKGGAQQFDRRLG
jgi:hypothetical protein